jgi:hypothetical protein
MMRIRWALSLVEYADALPASARLRRAVLVAVAVALACAVLAVAPASAQSDALLLARSCVSERGWRVETDDCAAIAEVVRARMDRRGEPFRDAMRALAPRLHGGTITSRLWLLDLDEDAHRPHALGPAAWSGMRRDAWIATLAEARAILAGEVASPCAERPEHWGSAADIRRRYRAGYRWRDAVCTCATFANRFGFLTAPREVDPE